MKNLITTIFAATMLATTAQAEMTIVNPGSEEGAFRQVSLFLRRNKLDLKLPLLSFRDLIS